MTKSCVASLGFIATLILAAVGAAAQATVNAAGNWNVTASGEAFANGTLKIEQSGSTIDGTYGQGGRIDGKFEPGTLQVDANWNDARGTGWMTIVFTADGSRFSGEWGRPGSRPSGHFAASRVVYPVVTGHYHVTVTGGSEFTSHSVDLRQLGQDVVGNFGPGTQLNGTMASDSNTFAGTWKGPDSNGWIKLQFADDSKSFEGDWGLAAGAEASGHIVGSTAGHSVGSTVDHSQLWVRGLWDMASSGEALTANTLSLQQQGPTVVGSYKGGHLQGTLPRGSLVLTGRWRDSRGSGDLVFKFASDGKSFHGTWTRNGSGNGSIIGKRVIAATPALRQ
jgi:hypothetical protein